MLDCSFELNDKPMSFFKLGVLSFPAFSGIGSNINKRSSACIQGLGPIPPGSYYILDRQSGGFLGALWDYVKDHSEWFALYAIDAKIDDETYCNQVKRGNFRLHPKGRLGISKGCITIESQAHFNHIRAILRNTKPTPVVGTDISAYGTVVVK